MTKDSDTTNISALRKILASPESIESILSKKYTIDPYQREYKWTTKNITDLIEDLCGKFLEEYDVSHDWDDVKKYSYYFMGSIVLCEKNGENIIVDGQQRLISLTLLLIHLNRLQENLDKFHQIAIESFIISKKFGKRTPNIQIEDRIDCLRALHEREIINPEGESAKNILNRFDDIEQNFPSEIGEKSLPYFIEWLLNNVQFVQITTYSSEDAYRIFETINDRGLSLTPADMLKGYLLTKIKDDSVREQVNDIWKKQIVLLRSIDGDEYPYFFKSWLRAKYAKSTRTRKKGSTNKDYEHIGTIFHKWVRENSSKIGLSKSSDFRDFIKKKLVFFVNQYVLIRNAADVFNPEFEHIYYNSLNNFTLQYPLILASLRMDDSPDILHRKMRLVSKYIDIYIAHRGMNRQTWGYSSVRYSAFGLMKDIRNLEIDELAKRLKKEIDGIQDKFRHFNIFRMHQQNRRFIRYFLSRITQNVERECGGSQEFDYYYYGKKKDPIEVEHVIPYQWDRYKQEFQDKEEFERLRNMVGGLLLLPKSFNQSYGAKPYEYKVKKYYSQNLLAKSLSHECYDGNPKFLRFVEKSELPFKPHEHFVKEDIQTRHKLYKRLAELIWNPRILDEEIEGI